MFYIVVSLSNQIINKVYTLVKQPLLNELRTGSVSSRCAHSERDKNDDIPSSEYAELSEEGLRDPTGSGGQVRATPHTHVGGFLLSSLVCPFHDDVTLSGFQKWDSMDIMKWKVRQ